ncbi:ankyrin repeat-containing protein, partial [Legionella quinlivanii]
MPVQTKIIDSVNELLKKKGFELKLNTGGVCGGLASIYVKYFLEGKETEFFEMERKLANPPKNYNMGDDPDFDNFIKDVEIAFNSQIYHKGTYQGDLNAILKFDGKPVNNEYNIGLVDTRAKWGEILGSIKNEGRACYVASNNHAIAISFSNNRYVVYDPNYDEDDNKKINNTKSFDTAAKAIEEIEKCFGDVNPSNLYRDYLGISVRVFAHPNEKRAAVYPSKTDLHRTHFSTPPSLTRSITHPDGYGYDSMTCAIRANDTETIQHLFQHMPLNAAHVVSAEHHTRYKLAFDIFKRLSVNEAERVLRFMSEHGSADLFEQMLDNYFTTKSNDPNAFKQKFVHNSNPAVKVTSLLEFAVKGKDKKNIEVLAQFLKAHSIDSSSLDINPIIEALKKNIEKDKSGILENLFLHFPDLINEKMIADLLKVAAENNSSKSLKILLQQVSRLNSASKDSIFDEKIISKITPDNLKLLADANIPIPQSLFATALNRKEPAIFATCVGALSGNDPWVHFLKKAVDGKFKKGEKLPISLFDAGKPYTPFKVLTRFPNNNQIILDNWPTRKIPQFTKNEALSWAVESGNVEIAEKLRQSGATLKIDTLEKLIADYPNRQDKMYNFLLDRLKTLIVGQEETLARHAAQVIHHASFHDTPNGLKEVAVLFRDSRLLDQSHLIPALNPEMKAMQTASGDDLIRLDKLVKHKKYPAAKYAYRWAILNKEFEFASSLSQCFTASPNYFYNLFLEVNRLGDDECLNHLFMEHSSLLENVDLYKQLEEQGQFTLLNKIIRQNKLQDDSYRLQLLNRAVERHDEKLVVALSKFVNSGYSTNATPVYKALAAHNSKGLILLLENGALLKDITASDVVDTLVRTNDIQLFHKVFEDKHFQSRFFDSNQLIRHLEKLYEKGNSELLGEFNKKFPELDFKRLKDTPDSFKFSAFGENVKNIDGLFDQACSNQCLTVVNSLLETYQPKAREKESLFERLDDLFNAPYRTEKIRPFNPQLVRQRRQERESIEAKERDATSGANKRTPSVLQRLSPDQQKMMVQGQFHGKTPPPLQQRKSLDPLAKQAPVNPGDESAKTQQRKLPDPPVTRHPPVDTNDNTPINEAMKKYHWRKVFDTLYDKKLGRLYSLIKNENYAPFEESHRKIEDVIINLRTSQKNLRRFADVAPARNERRALANSLLENKLILRALDEDNEDKLLPLMQQIKPEQPEALVNDRSNSLNDEVMALFKKYAKTGQTKVISNLFSFYEANSVIRLALEKAKQNKEEWGTLVGLLQSCTYTSPEHSSPPIDKELISELEKYREDLLNGFKNASRDIRMELVQLLDKKTDSALAWILKSEHGQVNTLLNAVEGEMVKAESSIPSATRSKVSRFMVGLDEFKNTIDKLQIRYNHFLETISSNDYAPMEALQELTAIKKEFQEGKLTSYYFTDGALLDHLLDNLPKHNKDNIQDLLQIKQKIDQMSRTFVDYLEGFQKAGFNAKTALQQLEVIHQTFENEQLIPAYFAEEKWIETLFEQLNKYQQKTINEPQMLSFLTDLYKVISEEAGPIQKTTQAPQADQQKAQEEKIEQARQQAEREAKEQAAKEQAEREAQERAAKEQAEREAKEQAAKEQAEREAKEQAAKEQAEREAKEQAAKEQAEREAKEQAAKEQAEREAKEQAAKEQAEREAQERAAKEQAERETQERAAKEQAEREAKEQAAKEQAEREAQERAAKEQAEREAQERAAKEQAEREAQERAAKEQAERE